MILEHEQILEAILIQGQIPEVHQQGLLLVVIIHLHEVQQGVVIVLQNLLQEVVVEVDQVQSDDIINLQEIL